MCIAVFCVMGVNMRRVLAVVLTMLLGLTVLLIVVVTIAMAMVLGQGGAGSEKKTGGEQESKNE